MMSNTTHPSTSTNDVAASCLCAAAVDVYESDDALLLIAVIPGATADKVSVTLEGSRLHISADAQDGRGVATTYRRQVQLSTPVDPDQISAELGSGELKVHLVKASAHRPKRVEVRAA